MGGWQKQCCPNSSCQKRFFAIHDVLCPDEASANDFFLFINYTSTGRVTKEELAAWYMANFSMKLNDAMAIINGNWHLWDVPKDRSALQLGWFRSQDQGDLDQEEFKAVQPFLAESLSMSLAAAARCSELPGGLAASSASGTSGPVTPEGKGHKRSRSRSRSKVFVEKIRRSVEEKNRNDSKELQRQFCNSNDKGRSWFEAFDTDESGELEKTELTKGLFKTFVGSHAVTHEQIASVVDTIWGSIDIDGSDSIKFREFQTLREAIMAQLKQDQVTQAVAGIVQSPRPNCG